MSVNRLRKPKSESPKEKEKEGEGDEKEKEKEGEGDEKEKEKEGNELGDASETALYTTKVSLFPLSFFDTWFLLRILSLSFFKQDEDPPEKNEKKGDKAHPHPGSRPWLSDSYISSDEEYWKAEAAQYGPSRYGRVTEYAKAIAKRKGKSKGKGKKKKKN